MSDNDDKPPAPPVRLTSCSSCNRGGNERLDLNQVDLKPLPKGDFFLCDNFDNSC